MRFLKNNSEIIVKLYVNQVGIAIFSFFLYTIVGALQGDGESSYSLPLKVAVSVLAILFYFSLIYLAVWEVGAKDKIRIDAGRAEKSGLKGLWIGLWANALNFIVWTVSTALIGIYVATNAAGLKSVFAVLNGIFRIFCSMYLGAVQGIATLFTGVGDDVYYLIESIGFTAIPILSVGVVFLAYYMGVNDYRIIPQKNK